MFTLIAQNKYGEQLELTHNPAYDITEIDGIDPPDATINTTKNAGADGSVFNSAYMNNRTITITLVVNAPTETNRVNLYRYFKSKFPVRLFYTNASRDVYIDGYVQSMSVGFFDKKQTVQIVVFCPQPHFNGVNESVQEFANIEDLFEFPFDIAMSKNLLTYPYYQTSRSDSGLTYKDNGDGSVTINGTNNSNVTKAFVCRSRDNESFYLAPGEYILSGGLSTTQRLIVNYMLPGASTATTLATSTGSPVTFTITDAISQYPLQVGIYTPTGGTWDNDTVYPMIRYASITDDTWESYFKPGIEFSSILTYVEKSIINNGDLDTGVVITIEAIGQVVTPKIYNIDTSESMILNTTLQDGDLVTINTRRGEKSITLLRNGVTTNLIGALADGSSWFELVPNDNLFTIAADSLAENMVVTFTIVNQYEGV